jgi:hypothetical protein
VPAAPADGACELPLPYALIFRYAVLLVSVLCPLTIEEPDWAPGCVPALGVA